MGRPRYPCQREPPSTGVAGRVAYGWERLKKPTTNREVDRNAIQEILGDLETRLEAYLVEWRGELGLRGVSEAGIDRTERLPAAPGREKEGVEPPVPKPARAGQHSP